MCVSNLIIWVLEDLCNFILSIFAKWEVCAEKILKEIHFLISGPAFFKEASSHFFPSACQFANIATKIIVVSNKQPEILHQKANKITIDILERKSFDYLEIIFSDSRGYIKSKEGRVSSYICSTNQLNNPKIKCCRWNNDKKYITWVIEKSFMIY